MNMDTPQDAKIPQSQSVASKDKPGADQSKVIAPTDAKRKPTPAPIITNRTGWSSSTKLLVMFSTSRL